MSKTGQTAQRTSRHRAPHVPSRNAGLIVLTEDGRAFRPNADLAATLWFHINGAEEKAVRK